MDWLHYGILLWITAALLFVGLGTMLTVIARRKQEPHAPHGESPYMYVSSALNAQILSICSACGQPTDDPGARWCGFCGQPLRRRQGGEDESQKRLVDLHTIDKEIQQQKQAIHHGYKANSSVRKSTKY